MIIKTLMAIVVMTMVPLCALAQGDPLLDLLKGSAEEAPPAREPERAADLCPKGMECVLVESFTRPGYEGEARTFQVGRLTEGKGFEQLAVHQHIGEKHGVIINTIKVRQGGRWVSHPQGLRLPEGRTVFLVPVPAGTQEIVISFDHGRGAELKVTLERAAP